jgi:hypothetical protein
MAAPADYWDEADLKGLVAGGLVNEDVMQKIWDISRIPLPFTDLIGTDTCDNSYSEWVQDALAAPNIANKVVSGADVAAPYDSATSNGKRVGNNCQNSVKTVAVTERSQNVSVVGGADEYARQLMLRQQELKRDVEAIALTPQASVVDNNNATAGQAGGFDAWIVTNTSLGATGAVGGFNTGTKLVVAPTNGTKRALAFDAHLRAVIEAVYNSNGDITVAMSVAAVVKRLNTYMLSTAGLQYAASPVANISGETPTAQVQQAYINVMRTDFGITLTIMPNRLQQLYSTAASLFLIDPTKVALAFLKPYSTKPLAKLGLSDRSEISVDWTLKVYQEKAHGVIRDIDPTLAVV